MLLLEPTTQTRRRDPKLTSNLSDRPITTTSKLDSTLTKLSRKRPRHEHHPLLRRSTRLRSGVHQTGGRPERAVQDWARLTAEHGDIRAVALIADVSNREIDRLNARAQHLRAERGELGHHEIPLQGVYYGLRQADLVAFTAQHRPRGQPRVENGTRGEIIDVHEHGVKIALDGPSRQIQLAGEQLDSLRLAYAQHVYRQQGATVERAIVLTGGWQTSKETAYVEATRALHGTGSVRKGRTLGVSLDSPS